MEVQMGVGFFPFSFCLTCADGIRFSISRVIACTCKHSEFSGRGEGKAKKKKCFMRRGQHLPSFLMSSNTQVSVKISSPLAGKIQGLVLFRKETVYNICSLIELNKFFDWVKFFFKILYNLGRRVKRLETVSSLSFHRLFCLLFPATLQARGPRSSSKEKWPSFPGSWRGEEIRDQGWWRDLLIVGRCLYCLFGASFLVMEANKGSKIVLPVGGRTLHGYRLYLCVHHNKNAHGHGLFKVTQCKGAHVHPPIRMVLWVTFPEILIKRDHVHLI